MAFGRKKDRPGPADDDEQRRGAHRSARRSELSKLDATPPWERVERGEPAETTGPFDERDAPDDELARVDLGALRIPLRAGSDLQLEMNEAQQVISATLASPQGSMQLSVFAAPRNEGIWDGVRAEITSALAEQHGRPAEREGRWGTELTGTVPGDGGRVPVRFIGVDGPRWFLRAMLAGPVSEPGRSAAFEDVLRDTVVVRGGEPIPVRDPVPLTLPRDLVPGDAPEPERNPWADPDGA